MCTVELFCSPIRNIFPRISSHDLPCHRTMKKYENSRSMEVFQFRPRKFWIQTWLCNCPQYPCLSDILFECTPGIRDQGKKDVGSLKSTSLLSTFTSGHCFVSFQPVFISSTYTDKNSLFSRLPNEHSQVGSFHQPCSNRTFSNCLSHNSPVRG